MKPTLASIKAEICRRLPLFSRLYERALEDHDVVVVVRIADADTLEREVSDDVGTEASGYTLRQAVAFYSKNWNLLGEAIGGEHHWGGEASIRGETFGDALARYSEEEGCPYWIVDHVMESSSATGSPGQHALTLYKPPRHEGVRTYRLLLVQRRSVALGAVQSMMDEE